MKMFEDKFVGENKKYKFFKNWVCGKDKEYDILLAESKENKERIYIIVKDNQVVGESQNIESIYAKIEILKLQEEK